MTLKGRTFNPKRRIRTKQEFQSRQEALSTLLENVHYRGNPEHKRNPGDFGLSPPAAPRPDKTLCDITKIFEKVRAEGFLREGLRRGMVSVQHVGLFPRLIWAVTEDGWPLEARLDNEEQGNY